MSPGFSMMGSGIYSETITREVVCSERCIECSEINKTCDSIWEQDFETDDSGNVDQLITCPGCAHSLSFVLEKD